jgi:hypothetical protein
MTSTMWSNRVGSCGAGMMCSAGMCL